MELATDEEKMYMEEALKEAALAALEGEIYVTMEPCPMCAGAIYNARIGRVVFGASDSVAGACGSLFQIPLHPSLHANTIIKAGIEAERCKKILQEFFTRRR